MLVLRSEDVQSILKGLTRDQVYHNLLIFSCALRQVATPALFSQPVHQPARTSVTSSAGHTTLFMPSLTGEKIGVKVVTVVAHGGGLTSSLMLFTPTGTMDGVLNAAEITGYRTAMASMVLFSQRMWHGKGEIVVFGAGKQAEWHVRLIMTLSKQEIGTVTCVNRSQQAMDTFDNTVLSEMRTTYPTTKFNTLIKEANPAYDMTLRGLMSTAVAVFCCTPSTTALFPYAYLESAIVRKKYLSLIGSYKPSMHEVDSDTIRSAEILCVDTREGCLSESGELIKAAVPADGMIELGELISPETGGLCDVGGDTISTLQTGNVVFKCVGMGIMDVVIGSLVLDTAKRTKSGIYIDDY